MKNLKKKLKILLNIRFSFFIILFFIKFSFANEVSIEIEGNNFTDQDVIISLIDEKPEEISQKYSNYLLKTLINSELFEEVIVTIKDNKYLITITEYSNINNIYFRNNERLDNDELKEIINRISITNLNPKSINEFIDNTKEIYESFGYNNIKISYDIELFNENNTADIYFIFNEGEITKINNVILNGNKSIDSQEIKQVIKSKSKTLVNMFDNNNFKIFTVENDLLRISNLYKNYGYIDVNVSYNIEFLSTNKVNIYFNIDEGNLFLFNDIKLKDSDNILNDVLNNKIYEIIDKLQFANNNYSIKKIDELKLKTSDIIISGGLDFFEIAIYEKKSLDNKINILLDVSSVRPKYTKQINIYGNTRTFDYVIRREIDLAEGDAIYGSQINNIEKK